MPPTTRPSSGNKAGKTGANVLRPLGDAELAPPASRLAGRPLLPVPFRPERNSAVQPDGAGLTKIGSRFREVFAALHQIDADEVDLGLIRLVEALNADTDQNHAALSAVQIKRTEFGLLYQVRFILNALLLLPWLINGRALRRLGPELGGSTKILTAATDHHRFGVPVMNVDGPEAVVGIVHAQRRLVKLETYTSAAEKRDRIDSIVRFGVLEAPDVMLTHLVSEDGSAWAAEAAEGAQRLFSTLIGLDTLAMRSVHSLATAHWFGPNGPALRDFTPEDLRGLEESLRFKATEAAGYFPGADAESWLDNTAQNNPAAVAWQLMRTMTVNLTLRVEPDEEVAATERNPIAGTIQELIRSYHVPGKMKDAWHETDVYGLVAIGAIDELREQGRVTEQERSSWLGETILPWAGPNVGPDGNPGNRLMSATRLMASMTAEHAVPTSPSSDEESVSVINRLLRHNSTRVHPDSRAKVAAAQAAAALGLSKESSESSVVAALAATFRSPWFWKTTAHGQAEYWPSLLNLPLRDLAERAQNEREKATADPSLEPGPAQRAIAALGGVALIVNPGLLQTGEALTRTGRGGGGKNANVKASDPSVLLERMVKDEQGIHQLQDAVAALIANAEQSIPFDRADHQPLTDIYLRNRWLGTDRDPSLSPQTEFARRLQELADTLQVCLDSSEELRSVTERTIFADDDTDDEHFVEDPLYETVGISEHLTDEAVPLLLKLNDFFITGKAFARAAARSAR